MSEEANQGAREEQGESRRRRRRRRSQGGGAQKSEAQKDSRSPNGSSKKSSKGGGSRSRRRRSRKKKSSQSGGEKNQGGESSSEKKSSRGKKGGGSRRRSRRGNSSRRRSKNQRSKNRSSNQRNRQNSRKGRSRRKTPVRKLKTPESKLGGREPLREPGSIENGPLEMNAFELFCAFHLGITENNNYRKQSLGEVARRFQVSSEEVKQALKKYGLDAETIKTSSFDMSLAELDMKVAPQGMDKKELARVLFDDFLMASPETKARIEASASEETASEEKD